MQNIANCLEGHSEVCKRPYGPILTTTLNVKDVGAQRVKPPRQTSKTTPSLLENDKKIRSQAEYHLSTIDDPLWQKICSEVARMMGSFAVLKISGCRLGSLSSTETG